MNSNKKSNSNNNLEKNIDKNILLNLLEDLVKEFREESYKKYNRNITRYRSISKRHASNFLCIIKCIYISNNNITNYKIDLVGVDLGLDLTKLQKKHSLIHKLNLFIDSTSVKSNSNNKVMIV